MSTIEPTMAVTLRCKDIDFTQMSRDGAESYFKSQCQSQGMTPVQTDLVIQNVLGPDLTLKLEKLQKEGVLQSGDRVKSTRLGSCQVVAIESTHTITVKNQSGKYFRISGLSLGSDVTMLSS